MMWQWGHAGVMVWVQARPSVLQERICLDGLSKRHMSYRELHTLIASLNPRHVRQAMKNVFKYEGTSFNGQRLAAAALVAIRQQQRYFQCNIEDSCDASAGVVATDVAIQGCMQDLQQEGAALVASLLPVAAAAAAKQQLQLRQEGMAATDAGDALQACVSHALATTLQIKFCSGAGNLLSLKVMRLSLLLAGGAGTCTRGHVDPAAATTFAYALLEDNSLATAVQCAVQEVLASWLFIHPVVFDNVQLLRKLLWLLQYQRDCADAVAEREAALHAAKAALANARGRGVVAAKQQHEAAVLALQDARGNCELRCVLEQLAEHVLSGDEALSYAEQSILQQLFTRWELTPAAMAQVEAVMGEELAFVIEQHAGEGVDVRAGWMHFVYNQQACVKIAMEVLRQDDVAAVVRMQRRVRCAMADLPDDYIEVMQAVVAELLQWADVVGA